MIHNSKILVTGASGFVGSHLTEELINNGAEVTATTHHPLVPGSYFKTKKLDKKCKVVQIELTDFKQVQKLITHNQQLTTHNQYDYIFHLAAQPLVEKAFEDPKTTFYSNIIGTVNVLESARLLGKIKGVIVASSDKAYGKLHNAPYPPLTLRGGSYPTETPRMVVPTLRRGLLRGGGINNKYLETDPLSGDHPYESSKSSADLIAKTYFKTYGLPVVITRFGNIYGEGDLHFSRLVPGIVKALVNKETFRIRSDGQYIRDYLYVKDVVKGYLMLSKNINKIKGEAFNFGSDDTYSVLSLIRLISQISQIRIKYRILNTARNEIPYQSLDWSKIEKTFGWKPEYNLKKTLGNIFQWYKSYFSFK